MLSCICSHYLCSPSRDLRLCCCPCILTCQLTLSSLGSAGRRLGLLLCSPHKCCWSWDLSIQALCKESKATGTGNRVTSTKSPSGSVSLTALCKASLDFTINTPKKKKRKKSSLYLLLFDPNSSISPQRLRLREVHRWTGAEKSADGVPGSRGAGLQTSALECGYTKSVSMRAAACGIPRAVRC